MGGTWQWIGFNAFVLLMLFLDLGVFHRKLHAIRIKEALFWTLTWIILALTFNLGVYYFAGKNKALEFLTGYLIEKSLSIDNIFIFILIFSYFNIPGRYQHKILFWGILGAMAMRAVFIFAGISLIQRFDWIIYVFAVFLVYTGIRMMVRVEKELNPSNNRIVNLLMKILPVTETQHDDKFFIKREHKTYATRLFVALVMIEGSDLIFAVDSIPAILAVSQDSFIVYTSNVFAILGLRSLYFALAHLRGIFSHLKVGLSIILIFVGIKMFLHNIYKIPTGIALAAIALILGVSIITSIYSRSGNSDPKGKKP